MKRTIAMLCGLITMLAFSFAASAQSRTVTAVLQDSSSGEPVGYATVSLTKAGATSASKYMLTDDKGKAVIEKVAAGTYTFKAELLGYKTFSKEITVKDAVNLGTIKLEPDTKVLDAASVTAAGNPIVIKKDTIEYNASSFKTTDNDMLEDLLKKLPGVEVGSDGSVTANGQTISKITIDGKTFFLDDPQLASKNIPAKIVDKVKVVQKKSEQAQFTGIDDGQEETVIDLSIQKGMMNGLFGNVMAGGGHDWPEKTTYDDGDWRYQGAAFIGRFTDKSQLSIILNGNNTNNRGFNDLSGSMMRGMRGGGGGMGRGSGGWGNNNGITTSWMGGVNGSWDLFKDKMDLGGNYLFNSTKNDVQEKSEKTTYLDDGSSLIYNNDGYSLNKTSGHRFGVRLEHKFSDNTSILFQPQFNFGKGDFSEYSKFTTDGTAAESTERTSKNEGFNNNTGNNNNWTANGFLLFRQRLGIPGRTLSFNMDYNFSNNDLDGLNQSLTKTFGTDGAADKMDIVNQWYNQNSKSSSISGRMVYTEPLGAGFYFEANYEYKWSQNKSTKDTYDSGDGANIENMEFFHDGMTRNDTYSSNILNRYQTHRAGFNVMYQKDKLRAQVGASVVPTITHNETNGQSYDSKVVNWSPSAMLWFDATENLNMHAFYFGNSSQPSTSQLMPIPDNTNPLNVSLGNPYLEPYFSHSIRSRIGYSNRKKFFSVYGNIDGGFVQDPIVYASWYNTNGTAFSLPVNGPTSGNVNGRVFINTPFGKSNFTLSSSTSASWSKSSSYVGKSSFDTSLYYTDNGNGEKEFNYAKFHEDFPDLGQSDLFTSNKTRTMNFTERLKLTYRNNFVELTGSGRSRIAKSWYTIASVNTAVTRNNQVAASMNWTIPGGLSLVSEFNYNWYRGYTTPQDDEYILNAELSKLLFKNQFTLSLKAYDLLNQSKNLSVSDSSNYHTETWNNTLGRYVILSLTWRFGNMNNASKGRRGPGGPGGPGRGPGPGGPPPMM